MSEADLPVPLLWVAGVLLVVLGRHLYWLFVGVAGFAFGLLFGIRFIHVGPEWLALLLGLLLGAGAALLAVFFQKVAVGAVGFLGGGLLLLLLADALDWQLGGWVWLAALAAALVGALLTRALFEVALAVLSALLGASFIVRAAGWEDPQASLFLLAIAGAGVAVQLLTARRPKRAAD